VFKEEQQKLYAGTVCMCHVVYMGFQEGKMSHTFHTCEVFLILLES